jgi:transcription factor IIIB 90 kDa subunit
MSLFYPRYLKYFNPHVPFLTHALFQRRKTNTRPRDAETAAGDTAAESVRNLLKKNPKYSKRINYDALKDLFVESGGLPSMTANMTTGDDDKDEADLYTMDDDKSDGEGVLMPTVIVEDEPGTVVLTPVKETTKPRQKGILALEDVDMDDEGSDDDKDDEGMGWEDAYEQEV